MTTENPRNANFAPETGIGNKRPSEYDPVRQEVFPPKPLGMVRKFVEILTLSAALLLGSALQTASAQDVSGSWQKVRQGCQPGVLNCQIKAMFLARNETALVTPASTLQVYLSNDMLFDGGDTLVQSIPLAPIDPGASTPVKMAFNLALGFSASASFLIAVEQGNSLGVYANPGPAGIVIFDRLFNPAVVTVSVGSRVRWMHKDAGDDHTVTSGTCGGGNCTADGLFTSGPESNALLLHDEFLHVFDTPGAFPFFCEVHGDKMIGQINVIP